MTDPSTQCSIAAEEREFSRSRAQLLIEIESLREENSQLRQAQFLDTSAEVKRLRARIACLEGERSRQAALTGGSSEIIDTALKSSREERSEILAALTHIEIKLTHIQHEIAGNRVPPTYEDVAAPRLSRQQDFR